MAFFDRSIINQITGFDPTPPHLERAAERFRYHQDVFVLPPWPELFRNNAERRHSFADAVATWELQRAAYSGSAIE